MPIPVALSRAMVNPIASTSTMPEMAASALGAGASGENESRAARGSSRSQERAEF
jgi:hypothetical protein